MNANGWPSLRVVLLVCLMVTGDAIGSDPNIACQPEHADLRPEAADVAGSGRAPTEVLSVDGLGALGFVYDGLGDVSWTVQDRAWDGALGGAEVYLLVGQADAQRVTGWFEADHRRGRLRLSIEGRRDLIDAAKVFGSLTLSFRVSLSERHGVRVFNQRLTYSQIWRRACVER